jgi:hypothetical protein
VETRPADFLAARFNFQLAARENVQSEDGVEDKAADRDE